MRLWVVGLLAISIATPINGGVLKVADAHKFWAESGITKEVVSSAISNANCFSNNDNIAACRAAVAEAKKEIDQPDLQWVDDDFNGIVDQVDRGVSGDKGKEWIFGLMLNSYVRTFDAHASVVPRASFNAAVGPDADVHYGIGMKIMATDAGVFVRAVTPNSPADAAKLKPFDKLVAVNGKEIRAGARGHRDTEMIRGEPGDVLTLSVERNGIVDFVKVTIGVVAETNVSVDLVSFNGRRYAQVYFNQFKEESCEDLKSKLRNLPRNIAGVILDLRDNPGGLVEEGVCVAGAFVGKKDIVGSKAVPVTFPLPTGETSKTDGYINWLPSYRDAEFANLPLIVLINQNSASAAEIVTGALQDYKRAWVVGDNSFGKGTVQTLESMPGDRRFVIGYTSALFYRPNGSTNQLAGVTPDFRVPLRRNASLAEQRAPREGDLYPNSLKPADALMQWKQTRPEADVLRRCVESTAVDLTANEMISKRTGSEDYQKAYALGLFDCSLGGPAKHNSSSARKKVAAKK